MATKQVHPDSLARRIFCVVAPPIPREYGDNRAMGLITILNVAMKSLPIIHSRSALGS